MSIRGATNAGRQGLDESSEGCRRIRVEMGDERYNVCVCVYVCVCVCVCVVKERCMFGLVVEENNKNSEFYW